MQSDAAGEISLEDLISSRVEEKLLKLSSKSKCCDEKSCYVSPFCILCKEKVDYAIYSFKENCFLCFKC